MSTSDDGWATARITHVAERSAWNAAQATGDYTATSLADEGFIHCSTPWQVARIARSNFAGRDDLVLLIIDPSRLETTVVFENCEGGVEPFPHIYGSIAIGAVVDTMALVWDPNLDTFPALVELQGPGPR